MRDELLGNFAAAADALIREGLTIVSQEKQQAAAQAMADGCLPELIYSPSLPVIVFRFVRVTDGYTAEIFRVENPPTARN